MRGSTSVGNFGSLWLSLIRFANKQMKDNRVLRRVGIQTYTSIVRINKLLPPPRVLLNGPPKSGTHLLSDCVALMPKMMFSGRHFALSDFFSSNAQIHDEPSSSEGYPALKELLLKNFLAKCPQGMFVTAHAAFHPMLKSLTEELEFKQVILLRDPRDLVVSQAFYIQREPLHHHHDFFARKLKSDEERIMSCIRGFQEGVSSETPLLSVGELFAGFEPWLGDASTLVIRFEDLVGSRGGGNSMAQLSYIRRIGEFIGRPLSPEQNRQIARKMYGTGSLTFRKGQTGDWRNHFTEAHRKAFKVVAGDTLIRLGYERDLNW
jgi:sulfotransferase 6B1